MRVEEVPADKLHARPGPHLNPVGWNYWHALRVWDLDINWQIKGQSPTEDAWHRGDFTTKSATTRTVSACEASESVSDTPTPRSML